MLTSERELEALVEQWSCGTLPPKEWTHAAHVAVCSYLAWHNSLAGTYRLMKNGLHHYLQVNGIANTPDRGYHETLTRFWCTLVFFQLHRGHYSSCLLAADSLVAKFGSDSRAERCYYSFDVLRSREARRSWIAPDIPCEVALEAFCW